MKKLKDNQKLLDALDAVVTTGGEDWAVRELWELIRDLKVRDWLDSVPLYTLRDVCNELNRKEFETRDRAVLGSILYESVRERNMTKFTCDSASKMVKMLNAELHVLERLENQSCSFTAAEDTVEVDRPEYNLVEIQTKMDKLMLQICVLKHAINVFNTTHVLPIGYNIDYALVRMSMLSTQLNKLEGMRTKAGKVRSRMSLDTGIYEYRNYSLEDADKEYNRVYAELSRIQQEINYANATCEFSVDVTV